MEREASAKLAGWWEIQGGIGGEMAFRVVSQDAPKSYDLALCFDEGRSIDSCRILRKVSRGWKRVWAAQPHVRQPYVVQPR